MSRRIRVEIGALAIHGASPLEGRRLHDALVAALSRAAAALAQAPPTGGERRALAPVVLTAPIRLERVADALAAAIVAAVRR